MSRFAAASSLEWESQRHTGEDTQGSLSQPQVTGDRKASFCSLDRLLGSVDTRLSMDAHLDLCLDRVLQRGLSRNEFITTALLLMSNT